MTDISFTENCIEEHLCNKLSEYMDLKVISRQVNCPAGVVDILAYNREYDIYYIIELKRGIVCPFAYVQVNRYAEWFNHNYSKNGKRVFVPLLIGTNLHKDLIKAVKFCNLSPYDIGSTVYRVFDITIDNGFTMNLINSAQEKYENEHLNGLTYLNVGDK